MTHRTLTLLVIFSCVNAGLGGCASQQSPFESVEICLKDADGVAAFKQDLAEVAQANGLVILDDSMLAERQVDAVASDDFRKKMGRPVVSIVMKHDDQVVAMAGNIGLPPGQVVLSFFDNPIFDSHRLASAMVDRLQAKWQIQFVPTGEGAQGIVNCT